MSESVITQENMNERIKAIREDEKQLPFVTKDGKSFGLFLYRDENGEHSVMIYSLRDSGAWTNTVKTLAEAKQLLAKIKIDAKKVSEYKLEFREFYKKWEFSS